MGCWWTHSAWPRHLGLGLVLFGSKVPLHPDIPTWTDGVRAAMTDGEDFELLFSVDPAQWPTLMLAWPFVDQVPLTQVGMLRSEADLVLVEDSLGRLGRHRQLGRSLNIANDRALADVQHSVGCSAFGKALKLFFLVQSHEWYQAQTCHTGPPRSTLGWEMFRGSIQLSRFNCAIFSCDWRIAPHSAAGALVGSDRCGKCCRFVGFFGAVTCRSGRYGCSGCNSNGNCQNCRLSASSRISQSQASRWPLPHEKSDITTDPAVTWGSLPNGLTYAILPNDEPKDKVSLRLFVGVGSLDVKSTRSGFSTLS